MPYRELQDRCSNQRHAHSQYSFYVSFHWNKFKNLSLLFIIYVVYFAKSDLLILLSLHRDGNRMGQFENDENTSYDVAANLKVEKEIHRVVKRRKLG